MLQWRCSCDNNKFFINSTLWIFLAKNLAFSRHMKLPVVKSREAKFESGKASIQDLLEAQRRLADAEVNYYQARVSHAASITNIHFEKGTLLAYNGVQLGEGAWCDKACMDHRREQYRHCYVNEDYRTVCPVVSQGPVDNTITNTSTFVPEAAIPGDMTTPQAAPIIESLPSAMPQPTNGFYDPGTVPTFESPANQMPQRLPAF
ncbi:MAG: hypothetical protein AAF497_10065 [Planctomycetota bacterium]